ncbi:MAG TPA: hypothetical protein VF041_20115 [Gemmatimonadaceae bacterium]
MTIGGWLATRTPPPPPLLAARLEEALAPALGRDVAHVEDASLAAAEAILHQLLSTPDAGRDRALDLLAADALVTYAFEAASDEPDAIAARADGAMARLARLAAERRA